MKNYTIWYLPCMRKPIKLRANQCILNSLRRVRTASQSTSVCILSDNRLFRESLGRILSKRGNCEVVLSQGTVPAAAEDSLGSADVVVLDSLEFLFLNGGILTQRQHSHGFGKVLLVAMQEDPQLFLRAIRAGAAGFIPKDASALDVVAAVRSVARGEAVCPPRLCKFLFDFVATQKAEMPSRSARCTSGLTRRERQLIPLIHQGLTNKEIAQQLNLSEQTVKNHVHRILHKIGVGNRLEIDPAIHTRQLPNEFGKPANLGTFLVRS